MDQKIALENFKYNPETGDLFMPARYGDKPLSGKCSGGYIRVFFAGKRYKAHRIIMLMVNGVWPEQVDHLNHDRSDNRWSNLAESNYTENSKNRSKRNDNTSGFCGVSFQKSTGKYLAQVVFRYKHVLCKRFDSFDDAKNAVLLAREQFNFNQNHGEQNARS